MNPAFDYAMHLVDGVEQRMAAQRRLSTAFARAVERVGMPRAMKAAATYVALDPAGRIVPPEHVEAYIAALDALQPKEAHEPEAAAAGADCAGEAPRDEAVAQDRAGEPAADPGVGSGDSERGSGVEDHGPGSGDAQNDAARRPGCSDASGGSAVAGLAGEDRFPHCPSCEQDWFPFCVQRGCPSLASLTECAAQATIPDSAVEPTEFEPPVAALPDPFAGLADLLLGEMPEPIADQAAADDIAERFVLDLSDPARDRAYDLHTLLHQARTSADPSQPKMSPEWWNAVFLASDALQAAFDDGAERP